MHGEIRAWQGEGEGGGGGSKGGGGEAEDGVNFGQGRGRGGCEWCEVGCGAASVWRVVHGIPELHVQIRRGRQGEMGRGGGEG